MSYEDDKICLCGDNAKAFVKNNKIGDKVKLTIEAVLTKAGIEEQYSPDGEEESTPVAEFEIVSVEGKKKPYDEMNQSEVEQEIHDVMNNEQPSNESGQSIWDEQKKQAKLNETPFKKTPPFGYR